MLALGIGTRALPGYILPSAGSKMSFPGGFWGDSQWELAVETLRATSCLCLPYIGLNPLDRRGWFVTNQLHASSWRPTAEVPQQSPLSGQGQLVGGKWGHLP